MSQFLKRAFQQTFYYQNCKQSLPLVYTIAIAKKVTLWGRSPPCVKPTHLEFPPSPNPERNTIQMWSITRCIVRPTELISHKRIKRVKLINVTILLKNHMAQLLAYNTPVNSRSVKLSPLTRALVGYFYSIVLPRGWALISPAAFDGLMAVTSQHCHFLSVLSSSREDNLM